MKYPVKPFLIFVAGFFCLYFIVQLLSVRIGVTFPRGFTTSYYDDEGEEVNPTFTEDQLEINRILR